ncbi:MAG: type I pullulanase [Clostridia bacterium]|nr:type I pullulanase [Clostridia bacterium]
MTKRSAFANITKKNTVKIALSDGVALAVENIKVYLGDREIPILRREMKKEADALSAKTVNTVELVLCEDVDITEKYRVVTDGLGELIAMPMGIFDTEYFAENYHYFGDDLGASCEGKTTIFRLWAPTASKVVLNLFEAGNDCEAYKSVEMIRGDKSVFSHREKCGHGTYYTYSVTTALGTQEAVDPYARAAGVNGRRGMVVDLSLTDPEGWADIALKKTIKSYSEAVIWEVHVRDFSNKIAASKYKGKYLAFTESGLTNEDGIPVGIDYLKNLGVTHVHLLPVYDYASVDEETCDGFNWGYDPQNYNLPEGSYSTDPYHGEVRIKEYKEMVKALHKAGIGVVMDMVYNHTYDANSNLNKTVPYYYYRYDALGKNTSASGCGNDTASERYMYGKYMVESCAYWVKEYGLDGLRFDLMGLHDLDTMQRVEAAVHDINPNAIIYGEGWCMGATIDGSLKADQKDIGKITPTGNGIGRIAVFNDAMRDGLKGSVFEDRAGGFINGNPDLESSEKVRFSILGGGESGITPWTVPDNMVVNYMSAHDNYTLWDKLMLTSPSVTDEKRARMNRLGAAILMISKGTPFWQAGEEMLRTKWGDENSYKSSDEVNNIDWSVLKPDSLAIKTMLYYRGLIRMRGGFDIFTSDDVKITPEYFKKGAYLLTYDDGKGGQAKVIINPHNTSLTMDLDGEWNLIADAKSAGASVIRREPIATAEPVSIMVYVNDELLR